MEAALLCLDIHAEMVVAVVLERTAKATRISGCMQVDTTDLPFAAALERIRQKLGVTAGKCRITVGAELFSFRNLELPFTDKKKIAQVLPMELAEQMPVATDTLVFDYVVTKTAQSGSEILAGTIESAILAGYLTDLRSAGFEPDCIGVSGLGLAESLIARGESNYILLDLEHNWATLIIICGGKVCIVRSLKGRVENDRPDGIDDARLALFVRQTLLGCRIPELREPGCTVYHNGKPRPGLSLLLGLPVQRCILGVRTDLKIDCQSSTELRSECLDRLVASAMAPAKRPGTLNFYKEQFRRESTFNDYRHHFLSLATAIFLGCMLAVWYFGHEYRKMAGQLEDLRLQVAEVFTATVPTVTRVVHPVQQLQAIINEVKSTYRPGAIGTERYSVIDLLAELSIRIPAAYSVKVVRLVADAEALQVKAITRDFNTVDAIQKELKKSPFFKEVIISSASQALRGDEVSFELKLVLTGK